MTDSEEDNELYNDDSIPDLDNPMRSLTLGAGSTSSQHARGQVSQRSEREVLIEAELRTSQKALDDAAAEVARLKEKMMELEDKSRRSRNKSQVPAAAPEPQSNQSASTGGSATTTIDKKAREAGQKYAVLCRPWISKQFLMKHLNKPERPRMDVLNAALRFHDEDSRDLAAAAEAWDLLAADPDLRSRIGHDNDILGQFAAAASAEKSKFLNYSMSNIGIIFEDLQITSEELGTPERRRKCAKLRALGPSNDRDLISPVLFPPGKQGQGEWMFRTNRAILVIKSALFGVTSVRAGAGSSASNVKAGMWELSGVTPGLIAFAAVVLIYFTSGDKSFKMRTGRDDSILWDYMYLYDEYVRLILEKYHTVGMQDLFRWYNRQLFNIGYSSPSFHLAAPSEPGDDTTERNRAVLTAFGDALPDVGPSAPPRSHTPFSSVAPQPPQRLDSDHEIASSLPPAARSNPPSITTRQPSAPRPLSSRSDLSPAQSPSPLSVPASHSPSSHLHESLSQSQSHPSPSQPHSLSSPAVHNRILHNEPTDPPVLASSSHLSQAQPSYNKDPVTPPQTESATQGSKAKRGGKGSRATGAAPRPTRTSSRNKNKNG